MAGKVNAIGVHVQAPSKEMNLSSLSFKRMVIRTVIPTKIIRVKFFDHVRFFDGSHDA